VRVRGGHSGGQATGLPTWAGVRGRRVPPVKEPRSGPRVAPKASLTVWGAAPDPARPAPAASTDLTLTVTD
jgi:hypothetical protein